jgi:hypothetical protein
LNRLSLVARIKTRSPDGNKPCVQPDCQRSERRPRTSVAGSPGRRWPRCFALPAACHALKRASQPVGQTWEFEKTFEAARPPAPPDFRRSLSPTSLSNFCRHQPEYQNSAAVATGFFPVAWWRRPLFLATSLSIAKPRPGCKSALRPS